MSIFTSFNVNASGMTAQRYRMDIISENVANMNTTRTEDGTPYRRKVVLLRRRDQTREPSAVFLELRATVIRIRGLRYLL